MKILIVDSRFKQKSKFKIWFKRILAILFFIVCISLVYFFFFSSIFKIKQIILFEDGKEVAYPELSNKFEELLNNHPHFFLKKNIFFLNKKDIEKKLLDKFLELKALEIHKKLPDKIIISFTKRKAEALFCNLECYLVDETGLVFAKSLKTEGFLFLVVKTDLDIKIGNKIIDEKFIDFMKKIKSEFNLKIATEISIEEFSFLKENSKTQDVLAKVDEGWIIYFDLLMDPEEQLNNLKQVLELEIKDRRKNLEYIDLRFGNKIFYKYKRIL